MKRLTTDSHGWRADRPAMRSSFAATESPAECRAARVERDVPYNGDDSPAATLPLRAWMSELRADRVGMTDTMIASVMRQRTASLITLLVIGWLLPLSALGQLPKGIVVEKVDPAELADEAALSPFLSLNIDGHTASVNAIAFSPDSDRLFTAGQDKVVHVWNAPGAGAKAFAVEPVGWRKSHSIRWEIARGLRGSIYALTVSPDGARVAIGGFGARGSAGDIVWADADDGAFETIARGGHGDSVTGIDYSSDGRFAVSTDLRFGRTMLWDFRGREPVGRKLHEDPRRTSLSSDVFAGAGQVILRKFDEIKLAKGGDGRIIEVPTFVLQYYNVNTRRSAGQAPMTLYKEITALAASRDGRYVATADGARRLYLYKTGDTDAVELGNGQLVRQLSFSREGRYLALTTIPEGERGPQVQIWDTRTRQMTFVRGLQREAASLAISPNGKWIACGGADSHHVFVWELNAGRAVQERATLLRGGDRIVQVKAIDHGGSFRTTIRLNTGEERIFDPGEIDDDPLRIGAAARAMIVEPVARGPWSARVSNKLARVQLYQGEAARGRIDLNDTWQGPLTSAASYCFIPGADGRPSAIAIGTKKQNGIFIYNLAAAGPGKLLRYFRGHSEEVTSLSVTGDRRYLVSGSADGTVRYWKLGGLHDNDFFSRWGAEVVQSPDRRSLIVRNCVDSGPLFHKGVRNGDVIEKILWASDEEGDARILSTVDMHQMYTQMRTLPMHKQFGVQIRRGEKQLPRFNVVSGWNHLLAVYIHREDWIAWHPSGYYACSPGGNRLIGWQINEDIGNTPKLFPAVRFHKSLYKPEEVSKLLSAGGLAGPELQSLSEPPAPPVVELLAPAKGRVEHDAPTILVRARAKAMGSEPLLSMQLLINGVPAAQYTKAMEVVAADRDDHRMDWVEREWVVDLQPGEHTIAVRADTRSSHAYSSSTSIVYQPAKAKRTLHLLAIAVNEYQDEGVSDLRFCVKDSERIGQIFTNRGKGLFDEVVITSISDKDATRESIESAFKKVAERAGMNDLVVLFYSGHGHRVDDRFFMVTHDANLHNLPERGVSEASIKGFCRAIAGQGSKMVIMVDACRSGAMRLERLTADLATDDFRVAMMASSKGSELSYEHDSFGGGAFTEAIWLGMHDGEADKSTVADNRVDHDELGVYVRRKVQLMIKEIAPEIKREHPAAFIDTEPTQTPVSNFQALDPIALTLLPE